MLASFARTYEIKVDARGSMAGKVPEKTKEIYDQRAPVNRYYLIKCPRSLDMKYYVVTGGLSSIAKLYNKFSYYLEKS